MVATDSTMQQTEAYVQARNSMPPPVQVTAQDSFLDKIGGFFGATTPKEAQELQAKAAHIQAADVMDAYQVNTADAVNSMPKFVPPAPVTVDVPIAVTKSFAPSTAGGVQGPAGSGGVAMSPGVGTKQVSKIPGASNANGPVPTQGPLVEEPTAAPSVIGGNTGVPGGGGGPGGGGPVVTEPGLVPTGSAGGPAGSGPGGTAPVETIPGAGEPGGLPGGGGNPGVIDNQPGIGVAPVEDIPLAGGAPGGGGPGAPGFEPVGKTPGLGTGGGIPEGGVDPFSPGGIRPPTGTGSLLSKSGVIGDPEAFLPGSGPGGPGGATNTAEALTKGLPLEGEGQGTGGAGARFGAGSPLENSSEFGRNNSLAGERGFAGERPGTGAGGGGFGPGGGGGAGDSGDLERGGNRYLRDGGRLGAFGDGAGRPGLRNPNSLADSHGTGLGSGALAAEEHAAARGGVGGVAENAGGQGFMHPAGGRRDDDEEHQGKYAHESDDLFADDRLVPPAVIGGEE